MGAEDPTPESALAPAPESSASAIETSKPPPVEPVEVVKEEVIEPPKPTEPSIAAEEGVKASEAEGKSEEARETPAATVESVASFKEESYYVKDLKESEKKALEALKAKIEEAIKGNTLLEPPKSKKPATPEVEKKADRDAAEKVKEEEHQTDEAPKEGVVEVEPLKVEGGTVEAVTKVEEGSAPPVAEEERREIPVPEKEEAPAEIAIPEKKEEEAVPEEDNSPSLDDLSLWGIPLLPSKGDERTNVLLLKFLRARDFKVKDSLGMLQDTMTWRKNFNVDGLAEEEILAPEFESMVYMHGVDKTGHPVCYNKELDHKSFDDEEQVKKFLQWRVQTLEKDIQKLDFHADGVHSMVQVVDFKHLPGLVFRKSLTKKVLSMLQDNYPELVAKQIFINVPWYFGAFYTLHGKVLTPRSKSKVVLARPGKVTETLFRYISPENIPVEYGGLSRLGDTEFAGVDAPVTEVIVKAGEKKVVDLPVNEAGSTVVWDFGCVGWELVYGEEFVPQDEAGYTVIIQKAKKVAPTEEPVRNTFKANEPGKVVITLDNTTSRRKKLAIYRYVVKKA